MTIVIRLSSGKLLELTRDEALELFGLWSGYHYFPWDTAKTDPGGFLTSGYAVTKKPVNSAQEVR